MAIHRIGVMPNISHAKASLAQQRLIGQLRRSETEGAAAVAAHLETCGPSTSCRSVACPICGLAFQGAALDLGEHFIRIPAQEIRNRTHLLTIVPDIGCVGPDELSVEVFERVGAETLWFPTGAHQPGSNLQRGHDGKAATTLVRPFPRLWARLGRCGAGT